AALVLDRDLHEAQERAVATLAHELGVDPQPPGLTRALGQVGHGGVDGGHAGAMLRAAGRTARRRARSRGRTVWMGGLTAVLVRMLRLGCGLARAGRRRLVGPVAVGAVEVARLVLGVALALALDADAEDHVQQPDGQAGADDARAALDAGLAAARGDDDDQPAGDDRQREPDADDAHPHRAASALGARTAG